MQANQYLELESALIHGSRHHPNPENYNRYKILLFYIHIKVFSPFEYFCPFLNTNLHVLSYVGKAYQLRRVCQYKSYQVISHYKNYVWFLWFLCLWWRSSCARGHEYQDEPQLLHYLKQNCFFIKTLLGDFKDGKREYKFIYKHGDD